ncbi:MAG: putative Ig domain-containing protein [Verrucomicrobia bacterium]|nr:putative Ig domain-containing protein [Verrucomicrobiota bacterium]
MSHRMNQTVPTRQNYRREMPLLRLAAALALVLVALLLPLRAQATTNAETVALWLFDETSYPDTPLLDGTQNAYDLRLTPTGQLTTGKYGNALRLAPGTNYNAYYSEWDGSVVSAFMLRPWGDICGLWGPTITPASLVTTAAGLEWTCEFWLKLAAAPSAEAAVLHFGYAYDPGLTVNLTAGSAGFRLTNNYGGWAAVCPVSAGALATGAWHHVAFTVSATGNRVNLFVDGQQQAGSSWNIISKQSLPNTNFPASLVMTTYGVFDASQNYERFRSYRFNLSLGEDRHGAADLDGYLDEVRVSSVVRYTGNFTPPGSFSYNYGTNAPADSVTNGPAILFGTNAPSGTVQLGSRRHLFIDSVLLDTTNNVQRTVNIPRIEPVVTPYLNGDLNVVDHAGEVWVVLPDSYESGVGAVRIYESANGTNFTAPSLGVIEYNGSTNNNLVLNHTPMWAGTFKDTNPNIPADERFKMTGWVANSGIQLFTSGDLIHWRRNETMMLPLCSGGGSETYWDDQNGYYKYFIKRDPHFASPTCASAGGRTGVGFETRAVTKEWPFQVLASPYYAGWASPVVTCEGPVVFGTNSFGDVYRTRAIKYPWAPDVYLAFVWRFAADDVRRTELSISRDGTNWTGLGATGLYLPSGMAIGGFTNGEAMMHYGLVRRGNSIWQYADFNNGSHHGYNGVTTMSAFARLVQRLDGFVSFDAGTNTGLATTRPLVFSGSRLVLNLDSHSGVTKVALLDTNGVALAGYALTDCDPITADSVNQIVTWHSNSSVASLSGTAVRVQLQMTQSKLYALQFATSGPVVVDTVEYWNGLENPHALDGVTLTGAGVATNPYVYTIPAGMSITANGAIWLTSDLGNTNEDAAIKFVFAGGDLQMEAGAVISTSRPLRTGAMDFILDMAGHNITGAGKIVGLRGPAGNRAYKPRDVTVTNAVDVTLQDITQAAGGSAGGNIVVKARNVTVNDVDTRAFRTDNQTVNGSLELRALDAGAGFSTNSSANAFTNRLTLAGRVLTAGFGTNIGSGGVKLYGVVVQLNGGYSLTLPANGTLDVRAGITNASTTASNLFVNASVQSPAVAYSVTWNNTAPGGSGPVFTTNQISRAASTAGVAYSNSIAGTATDGNGDALTYAKGTGPVWLTIAANGTLSGTPATADVGTNSWTVSVSDGTRLALATLKIVVRTKPVFLSRQRPGVVERGGERRVVRHAGNGRHVYQRVDRFRDGRHLDERGAAAHQRLRCAEVLERSGGQVAGVDERELFQRGADACRRRRLAVQRAVDLRERQRAKLVERGRQRGVVRHAAGRKSGDEHLDSFRERRQRHRHHHAAHRRADAHRHRGAGAVGRHEQSPRRAGRDPDRQRHDGRSGGLHDSHAPEDRHKREHHDEHAAARRRSGCAAGQQHHAEVHRRRSQD